jgi:hypothetical protein
MNLCVWVDLAVDLTGLNGKEGRIPVLIYLILGKEHLFLKYLWNDRYMRTDGRYPKF